MCFLLSSANNGKTYSYKLFCFILLHTKFFCKVNLCRECIITKWFIIYIYRLDIQPFYLSNDHTIESSSQSFSTTQWEQSTLTPTKYMTSTIRYSFTPCCIRKKERERAPRKMSPLSRKKNASEKLSCYSRIDAIKM